MGPLIPFLECSLGCDAFHDSHGFLYKYDKGEHFLPNVVAWLIRYRPDVQFLDLEACDIEGFFALSFDRYSSERPPPNTSLFPMPIIQF
jgi:hypothetical protein